MKDKCLICGREIEIYHWSIWSDAICHDCKMKIFQKING